MSVNIECLNIINNLVSVLKQYTGGQFSNLTDAIKELKNLCNRGFDLLKSVTEGHAVEITAADLKGIKTIKPYLFNGCTGLLKFEIPPEVTDIGEWAFNGCYNVDIPSLPEDVKELNQSVFYQCYSLSLKKLPDALTYIGETTFGYCTKLAITEIPEGVTSIGRSAFSNCTSLKSITFKGTPDTIDRNAFLRCTNLTVINVPWAEDEVANAPWGATNATVNYNYVG